MSPRPLQYLFSVILAQAAPPPLAEAPRSTTGKFEYIKWSKRLVLTRTEELEHQILSIAIGPTVAAVNRRLAKDIAPFTDEEFDDEQARQTAAEYWERQTPRVKQTEFRRRVVETPQGALRRTEKGSQRFAALAAQKEVIGKFSAVKL